MVPEIGVTATPVIDRTAEAHGVICVVAMSKSGSNYFHLALPRSRGEMTSTLCRHHIIIEFDLARTTVAEQQLRYPTG